MLRRRSNTLISVRRETQHNAGRSTTGADGEVALTSPTRARLAQRAHQTRATWTALPVRWVFIPKVDGRQRPLGIPVILDRCIRGGPRTRWSRSGKPGSSPDHMGSGRAAAVRTRSRPFYWTLNGKHTKRQWILDADLKAVAGRLVRDGRRLRLRIATRWPWAIQLTTAFTRLQVLPKRT